MYSTARLGFGRGIVVLYRFWTGAIAPSTATEPSANATRKKARASAPHFKN